MNVWNGNIEEFHNYMQIGKRLVVFGSGNVCRNFFEKYPYLVCYIDYIIDNDVTKCGTDISLENNRFNIKSPLKVKINSNQVVLIAVASYFDVFFQIKKIENFKNANIAFCFLIYSKNSIINDDKAEYPNSFRISDKPLIPKIIHYCWFGKEEMPVSTLKCIDSWKKYCPDYEIKRWNEKNFDYTRYNYTHSAYNAKKWAYVSDVARLDVVYNYGGIYLDTDVELIKNLDDLLYQNAFMGVDGSLRVSTGLGFGAEPQNKVIKRVLDEYNELNFDVNHFSVCPNVEKHIYKELGYKENGKYQVCEGLTIYPEKVLSGKCCFTHLVLPTEHTYSIHHYDGSWNDKNVNEKIEQFNRQIALENHIK